MTSYNDIAMQNVLTAYEELIQERYPSVNVIPDTRFADEYGVFFCAVGVTDDQRGEFTAFALDELAPKIEEKGLETMGILPYSLEDAEAVFPDVHEQLWRKKAQSLLKHALASQNTTESWITPAMSVSPASEKDGNTEGHVSVGTFKVQQNPVWHASDGYSNDGYSKVTLSNTRLTDDSESFGSAA